MCDQNNYPDYCSACNASVMEYSPSLERNATFEQVFLNGCWGLDNTNVTLYTTEIEAADACNQAGVAWRGSNPDKPLPPKP